MKIQLLIDIGTFHGRDNVKRGDVVDVPEVDGLRYIKAGYAKAVPKSVSKSQAPVEKAVVELDGIETASLDVPPDEDDDDDGPAPLDEQEDEARARAARTARRRAAQARGK